jgi:hypothetical protein
LIARSNPSQLSNFATMTIPDGITVHKISGTRHPPPVTIFPILRCLPLFVRGIPVVRDIFVFIFVTPKRRLIDNPPLFILCLFLCSCITHSLLTDSRYSRIVKRMRLDHLTTANVFHYLSGYTLPHSGFTARNTSTNVCLYSFLAEFVRGEIVVRRLVRDFFFI